jgi:hypothetical protein
MKPIAIFPGDSCIRANVMRPLRDTCAAYAMGFVFVAVREEFVPPRTAAPVQQLGPDIQPRLYRCCNGRREEEQECDEAPNHVTATDRVFHSCLRFMPGAIPGVTPVHRMPDCACEWSIESSRPCRRIGPAKNHVGSLGRMGKGRSKENTVLLGRDTRSFQFRTWLQFHQDGAASPLNWRASRVGRGLLALRERAAMDENQAVAETGDEQQSWRETGVCGAELEHSCLAR